MLRHAIPPTLVLALALPARAPAAPLKVCAFSFHSPYEVAVFKSHLPAEDFDVLDLAPRLLGADGGSAGSQGGASAGGAGTSWMMKLCRRDLKCDVVVYSAEFAGRFFGNYGASIGLQEMEEAACQARCDGLFHYPREVFLLACNTLATKDQDRRTPADYLQVLLNHGFDRTSAERVVALRYGPLGPSFREALRRVFMRVPRIYGFSSVAPTGDYVAPMLERYFRTKGDYRQYLERAGRDTAPNKELLAAFAGAGLVQAEGLAASDAAAADRDRICAIYDEHESVLRRLEIIRQLTLRSDFLAFVPSMQVFVDRHPPQELQGEERERFEEIQRSAAARDQVLQLVRELDVSALRLEVAHFSVHMGWTTQEEFSRLARDSARRLLAGPLTSEVVDIMCEIPKHEPVGNEFGSGDIREELFLNAEGIRLIDCLSPPGEDVNARLLHGLDTSDELTRLWAAYALSHRLPLQDPVLLKLAEHLRGASADLRARLRWIFEAQRTLSRDVWRTIEANDQTLADELHAHGTRRKGFF